MFAIICPGQGSQTPGFLQPWLDIPGVSDRLSILSDAAQTDLIAHGTVSDEQTIKDTSVAQPLIVAAGLAVLPLLLADTPEPACYSGHSVGEFTALAAAGAVSPYQALSLVATRGRAMAKAAAHTPTGMSAVLGGDPQQVLACLEQRGLTAANINGAGQVVAAGTLPDLEALAQNPPTRSRVIPLKVAGAFHTAHMAPAVADLQAAAAIHDVRDAVIPVVSNRDGQLVRDGKDLVTRLVAQVARPVRWDLVMQTLLDSGITAVIEVPPASTLSGLAKRGMKGVKTVAVNTPDDLDAARAVVLEHSGLSVVR
ncbi:Malonyl CoA-acyl carrier protein transacylase [Austwickia sp. TVS 96-490-7B]|uniref:ACP S-malonyltransferase n=1 Tax=Austwickia sp. TVS 96-490-7B TaxID=2830843 RepID=UPI001C582624|nr:ACP S-malonyltransferase [Austwickia sp. TVS 96-490-7B]MBW3086437.1 Malonyl CoA-acyl carrier protein transacylase [Austwickia sp. TVS 96-490-7B]